MSGFRCQTLTATAEAAARQRRKLFLPLASAHKGEIKRGSCGDYNSATFLFCAKERYQGN